jgi:hypothetical protein
MDLSNFKNQNHNIYLNPTHDQVRFSWISQRNRSQDTVVGIATMLRAGRSGLRLPVIACFFFYLQKVLLASYSVCTVGSFGV